MVEDVKGLSADEKALADLGYKQQLHRTMHLWSTFSIGVASISPVVGIYAVMSLGFIVAGPSWVWAIPVCMIFQFTIATVYAELASQFPIAGGAYQWIRRLIGPRLGWFTGYFYMAAVTAALTTVAYLGGFWLFLLFVGKPPTSHQQVLCGSVLLGLAIVVNLSGINPVKYAVNSGIICEAIGSVGVGLALVLFFRHHSVSHLFDSFGSTAHGSYLSGFVAALAVCGWAFLGFDSCAQVSEETVDARRQVPRAIRTSLLTVGSVVILTAVAVTLSFEHTQDAVSGTVSDPVTSSVTSAFGSWSEKPFVAIVLISFIACAMAIQTFLSRSVFSMARDNMLPGSRILNIVSSRKAPVGAMWVTTIFGAAGLTLGLNPSAVGTLISFGTGGLFIVYLIVACAALYARVTGRWNPRNGALFLGRRGLAMNVIAVIWLVFESVNVAWPRRILVGPSAPFLQVWAVVVVFAAVSGIGLIYMLIAKPHLRTAGGRSPNPPSRPDHRPVPAFES